MGCMLAEHKRVLFILWGRPESADVAHIRERANALFAKHGPIVFIPRVPAGSEIPSEPLRKEMAAALSELYPKFASYHGLFEDRGFAGAVKRAMFNTMFLMSGRRATYFVHAHADEIVPATPKAFREDVRDALDIFRRRGLLDHRLATLPPPPAAAAFR